LRIPRWSRSFRRLFHPRRHTPSTPYRPILIRNGNARPNAPDARTRCFFQISTLGGCAIVRMSHVQDASILCMSLSLCVCVCVCVFCTSEKLICHLSIDCDFELHLNYIHIYVSCLKSRSICSKRSPVRNLSKYDTFLCFVLFSRIRVMVLEY